MIKLVFPILASMSSCISPSGSLSFVEFDPFLMMNIPYLLEIGGTILTLGSCNTASRICLFLCDQFPKRINIILR